MTLTGSPQMDAERAFTRARRSRRRAAVARRLRRHSTGCGRLPVHAEEAIRPAGFSRGIREVPLDAIHGTLEPSRATLFDDGFRPAPAARSRWQRVWLAEQRGTVLPPVALVPIGDGYAIRDGHHRVSVAAARGARTIDATIDAG